ncbi:hypothetical protein Taro_024610 [Colocasia esculenta]|uniref:Uncharacterized protein n=1 Tax=Colocasia esculenta TaxID=4460 RepID=A0A843VBT7_COLES|nr:hypothetical protein [Colocasia esculenta]
MATASLDKGAAFVLLFLLLCHPSAAAEPDVGGCAGEVAVAALDRQGDQLVRLESLVESLSAAVSRLESAVSECTRSRGAVTELTQPGSAAGEEAALRRRGGVAVTRHRKSWSERFQFVAAARLDTEATAAAVLPHLGHDGAAKYFAVGDALGRAFVLSSAGDVLVELPPPTSSPAAAPVTAMLAYSLPRRNESLLLIGHGDGSVVAHRLWESAATGDDWPTLALAGSRAFVDGDRDSPAVLGLEIHQVGRVRYVIASDGAGRIRVFTENGTLYGTAAASSRPLAFVKHRLLFLTETGAGSLDLRTMAVRETDCDGLNGTHRAKGFAFDVSERSKAYGFTTGGQLITVVVLGDAAGVKCRVRVVRKSEINKPVAVLAIKGYFLAITQEKVFVYNVSSHYYGRAGAPRPLFFATLEEIKLLFLDPRRTAEDGEMRPGTPLIAGDREKLLILGLGSGHVGVYRTNLPVYRAETNTVLWSSPALVFLLLLIGIWHFYVKKRDVLGLTQDEVFNPSTAASSGRMSTVVSGDRDRERDRDRDRSFGDGSIGSDLRDIRGGPLRGPPRRYISPPSRYTGGPAVSFRPGATDSTFRGVVDLKYRGQRAEPPGFPKRREPIPTSSQAIVDDHVD